MAGKEAIEGLRGLSLLVGGVSVEDRDCMEDWAEGRFKESFFIFFFADR
jgi:hypothetical protein